ncbi:MAG TPA: SprB repeat-containing protein [Bacteroidia bacterium]|jgi:hypothetical protein|nr:SprB repeat-containing protein [Bacteroidia bacterium]
MKEHMKYQPEDIEALLAEKSYRELYAEEKKFVLEHLASQEEYERMRETLLSIRGGVGGDKEDLHPGEHVRERLMKEFEEKKRRGAIIWWNGLLIGMRDTLRFDLPIVRYGVAVVAIVIGSFIWLSRSGNDKGNEMLIAGKSDSVNVPQQIVPQPVIVKNDSVEPNTVPAKSITNENIQPKKIIAKKKQGNANDANVLNPSADTSSRQILATNNSADTRHDTDLAPKIMLSNSQDVNTANTFTMNATSAVTTNVTSVTCFSSTNGSATVTSNGGTTYDYSWNMNGATNDGTPAVRSRNLGQDVNALKLFYELK